MIDLIFLNDLEAYCPRAVVYRKKVIVVSGYIS